MTGVQTCALPIYQQAAHEYAVAGLEVIGQLEILDLFFGPDWRVLPIGDHRVLEYRFAFRIAAFATAVFRDAVKAKNAVTC